MQIILRLCGSGSLVKRKKTSSLTFLFYSPLQALISSPDPTCASFDNPESKHECKEFAANSFLTAIKYDPDNEGAKHMVCVRRGESSIFSI
jgi:hypothetical protein